MRPDSSYKNYSSSTPFDLEHEITMFNDKMNALIDEIKLSPAGSYGKTQIKKVLLNTLIESL